MIVLLAPYKFTKFLYLVYELDFLKKNIKEKIEVHDLSRITNPKSEGVFRTPRPQKIKVFNTIKGWETHFKRINKKNKLIVVNLLQLNSFKSLIIHYKLYRYIRSFIQLKSPGHPNIFVKEKAKSDNLLILNKIYRIYKNKTHIKLFLKKKIILILTKLLKFNKIYYLKFGKKIDFHLELNSKEKIYIDYHSHDFSRMRHLARKKKVENNFGIFLDAPDPYFQDDYSLMYGKINYDIKQWYNDLNNFLRIAEQTFKCKIIIIPHPKVKGIVNPHYDKHFRVCNDLDAAHKLIPASKIVFSMNGSTSIGLAIASQKKVVIIYNKLIKKKNYQLFEETKFAAKKSNSFFLNINNFEIKNLKNIKKIKNFKENRIYKNYIYNYMTSKKISKKENHEIFEDLVKKIKSDDLSRNCL